MDRKINIKVNYPAVLAFVLFWSYALFGLRYFSSTILELLCAAVLALLCAYFFSLSKNESFTQVWQFDSRDVLAFAGLSVLIFIFACKSLFFSLTEDNIYHAQYALSHFTFLSEKLVNYFPTLLSWKYQTLLHLLLILVLFGTIAFVWFLNKLSLKLKLWVFGTLFFVVRMVMVFYGDISDPHPPFRLFPSWLMASIFGPHNWSFRAGMLLALGLLAFCLYYFAKKYMDKSLAFLFALAGASLPLLLHIGTILQPSLWAAAGFLLVILYLYENHNLEEKDFFILAAIISISTLMRQSAFIGWAFLAVPGLMFVWKNKDKIDIKKWLVMLSPVLVLIPLTLKTAISGTPASYVPGEVDYFASNASVFSRIWYAVESGVVFGSALNSLTWVGISLIVIGLILLFTKRRLLFLNLLIFLLIAITLFFSIRPILWGMGRYQGEYLLPLAIFGLFLLVSEINKVKRFGQAAGIVVLILIAGYNLYFFKHITQFNAPADKFYPNDYISSVMLSEYIYNYKDAFSAVKLHGLAGSAYVDGVSYGVFSEILNGYSVKQTLAEKEIFTKTGGLANASAIGQNSKIKLVLVSDVPFAEKKQKLINDLLALGFKPWKNFENKDYGSTIVGLIR